MAHNRGYTNKLGVYVSPFDDKRPAKTPKIKHSVTAAEYAQAVAAAKGKSASPVPVKPNPEPSKNKKPAKPLLSWLSSLFGDEVGGQAPQAFKPAPQFKPAPKPAPKPIKFWHPSIDEDGGLVGITDPHTASAPATWTDPKQQATFIPGGNKPNALNGVKFEEWMDVPETAQGWNDLPGINHHLIEPPLPAIPKGMHLAAGVVVEEPDGRIWTISPSNEFGGYVNTFPKGTVDQGMDLQASAIKEAYEESGLHVIITSYLADVPRSTSICRYYRAKRIGGDPTAMGWESQAVHLVPKQQIHEHLQHKSDAPLVEALTKG